MVGPPSPFCSGASASSRVVDETREQALDPRRHPHARGSRAGDRRAAAADRGRGAAPRRRHRSDRSAADARSAAPGTCSTRFIDSLTPPVSPAPGDRGVRAGAPRRAAASRASSSWRARRTRRARSSASRRCRRVTEVLHRTLPPRRWCCSKATRSTCASPRRTNTAACCSRRPARPRHVVDVLKRRGPRLSASETEVYTHAGLAYLPPETRDAPDALDRARAASGAAPGASAKTSAATSTCTRPTATAATRCGG